MDVRIVGFVFAGLAGLAALILLIWQLRLMYGAPPTAPRGSTTSDDE